MVARQRGAFPDAGRSLRGVHHSHHSRVTGKTGKPVSVTTMAGRAARSLSPRQAGDRPARGAPGPARCRGASPQQSERTLPRQRPVLRTVSRGVARRQAGLATPGASPSETRNAFPCRNLDRPSAKREAAGRASREGNKRPASAGIPTTGPKFRPQAVSHDVRQSREFPQESAELFPKQRVTCKSASRATFDTIKEQSDAIMIGTTVHNGSEPVFTMNRNERSQSSE